MNGIWTDNALLRCSGFLRTGEQAEVPRRTGDDSLSDRSNGL